MNLTTFFFWQPRFDFLRYFESFPLGRALIVVANYSIWLFLFYISFLLVNHDPNSFWQILIATIIGEVVEKIGKSHALWRRPLYQRNDSTPIGLVDSWYKTGSFPSGHTIKAVYFFLFVLQYQVFSPLLFFWIAGPLLFFRVLFGFHYPLDLFGGGIIGWIIWQICHLISFPPFFNQLVSLIFNFVFFLK